MIPCQRYFPSKKVNFEWEFSDLEKVNFEWEFDMILIDFSSKYRHFILKPVDKKMFNWWFLNENHLDKWFFPIKMGHNRTENSTICIDIQFQSIFMLDIDSFPCSKLWKYKHQHHTCKSINSHVNANRNCYHFRLVTANKTILKTKQKWWQNRKKIRFVLLTLLKWTNG